MQASSLLWMLCTLKRVVGITPDLPINKKINKKRRKFISVAVKLCLFVVGDLKNTEISRLN